MKLCISFYWLVDKFTHRAFGPFTRNKERLKNLCRLEIHILFTEMNLIMVVFNMIWLMETQ